MAQFDMRVFEYLPSRMNFALLGCRSVSDIFCGVTIIQCLVER